MGKKPEYDWYPEFRGWIRGQNRSVPAEQIVQRYAERLKTEGIAAEEIERRTKLLAGERDKLKADFWNRFFTQGKANYNTTPNSFLVQMVAERKPGTALDYGMGEGRLGLEEYFYSHQT